MLPKFFLSFLIAITAIQVHSQTTISGYIKDSGNGEVLIGANVYDSIHSKGTATNEFGFFSLKIPNTKTVLKFSYIGYQPVYYAFNGKNDSSVTIGLHKNLLLNEVIVSGGSRSIKSPLTGIETMDAKMVNTLPSVMGEPDLIKTLTLLPGVSFGNEAVAGFFVRGSSSDQNLILIDGVPVYNPYHLQGYFSVFNTDAINNAVLYKSAVPASFGGRLASVLDIQMHEGNAKKIAGKLTLGTVTTKALLEGPVWNDKTTFLFTARRSILDVMGEQVSSLIAFFNGMQQVADDINVSNYYFFDYNAKVNHRFNANNRLFFNLYQSKDNFKNKNSDYGLKENISWENSVASLRWNHVYPNSLFSNLTLYHSKYKYVSGDVMNTDQITYSTGIHDFSAKNDYNYNILNHSLRFGAQYLFQVVKPAVTVINQSATHTHLQKDTTYKSTFNTNQVTIYIEDEIQLIEKLTATAGFHLAGYASDRVFYPSLQPRVSANYNLVPSVSLKASYTRMSQPLHLLSNTWSGDPSDLWVPSTKRVKPENANQVAAGISYNYKSLFFSAEAWWKNMHNLVDYAQGASYANKNANWQDQITTGSGIAKGIELSIKREKGRATGLISYSFSKSERTFAKINNGKPFPYTYDRAHSITSALMLKLNDKYSLGANWVFASGQPVTITESIVINQLMWGDEWYYKYSSINGVRLPNYHRLDISLNYTKKYNIFDFQASTGVYNAYNRKNPYSVYDDSETLYINSLLGIVPYVTLTFSFNS